MDIVIPARFAQGETVVAAGTITGYPASSYDLSVVFITEGQKTDATVTKSGDEFTVTISKAVSADMVAGRHDWQAYVDDGADFRKLVGEGFVDVVADFANLEGLDARSDLEVAIANIKAVLRGVASDDQKKFKYADREIERYDRAELITIYKFLQSELKKEQREKAIAAGKGFGGRVRVRFP